MVCGWKVVNIYEAFIYLLASLLKMCIQKGNAAASHTKKLLKRSSVLFNVICNLWLTLYSRLSIYLYTKQRNRVLQMCHELRLLSVVYSQSTNLRLNLPSTRLSHSLVWHDYYVSLVFPWSKVSLRVGNEKILHDIDI